MLQIGTNIMANQVKTPIQNYFEKVLYGNLAFEIPPLWFFRVEWNGFFLNRNKPPWSASILWILFFFSFNFLQIDHLYWI